MKNSIFKSFIVIVLVCSVASAQAAEEFVSPSLRIPDGDDSIQADLNPPAVPELTPAELAAPQAGEIRKSHLRTVNQLRSILATTLAAVPAGAEGTGSPWFTKAQAYKAGLDAIATSCLQADCFALIPKIADLLAAKQEVYEERPVPDFSVKCAGLANGFSTVLINAIERHIIDQNATVSSPNLIGFIKVFSVGSFRSEGDWEGEPIPVDSAGIMILDAAAVVTHLKTQPWQEASQFLGNRTAADAFARYATTGNGMGVLKTKYAANQGAITAKWDELAAWVVTQRPAN